MIKKVKTNKEIFILIVKRPKKINITVNALELNKRIGAIIPFVTLADSRVILEIISELLVVT